MRCLQDNLAWRSRRWCCSSPRRPRSPQTASPGASRTATRRAGTRRVSPALYFVDLRTAANARRAGASPGRCWVPLRAARDVSERDAARLADEVLRAVAGDRTRTLILVCAEGVKALAAAAALRTSGFQSVLVVEGGLWAGEPWLAFDLE